VPKPEPEEYALDYGRAFDQRHHAHLRAAFRADERTDLVDLANPLRPGGFRGLARAAMGFSVGSSTSGSGWDIMRVTALGRHM
jgi:hypothetical protein